MKRLLGIIAILCMLAFAATAMAEEDQMDKAAACKLLGDCGDNMVNTAKRMKAECDNMIEQAQKLIDQGKMIRGQGKLWADEDMVKDGDSLITQGKMMMDHAKTMGDACAMIIEAGEKTKKKYSSASKKQEDTNPAKVGDHSPM